MKAYLAILKIVITSLLQYRAAILVRISTGVFWGMIHVAVISAFYAGGTSQQPLSLPQAISLTWLGQVLLQFLPWTVDAELEEQIKNGNVAYELTRPINLYWMWFFRSAATRIIPALLHAFPVMVLAVAVFNLPGPPSLLSGIGFCTSVTLAATLSTAMSAFIVITLFWTLSGDGIKKLLPHTSLLLSGVVIPLPLFPTWAQTFLNIQPFRAIVDIPSRIYTGVIPDTEIYLYLCMQMVWILGFIWAGQWLMQRAMKRFVVQGG
jgi:ABC-2 type transport system permease protein